jgi:hypothetical protein
MSPDTQDLLALFAEVAIGTVALSGITMVLVMARQAPGERETGLVAAQLGMAFAVVIASMLPLLFGRYGLAESPLWRVSSGSYVAIIVALQILRLLPDSGFPKASGRVAVVTVVPGVSGVVLLGANLWLGAEWPYLTQLMIALAASMVLYFYFVLIALSAEQKT